MYSKTIMIGTIRSILENKNKTGKVIISTTRPFPDKNFVEKRDLVELHIWEGYFKKLKDYLHEGMLIAVEGRIESKSQKEDLSSFTNYLFVELLIKLSSNK